MKVGIMQPYIFPYLGYWQLINEVDIFIILDDVNYIKRGYINRNRILLNGVAYMFSIPIVHSSQNRLILDTKLSFDSKSKERFLKMIYLSYKRARYFDVVYPIIEEIVLYDESDLTRFVEHSFLKICRYMEVKTEFIRSSQIRKSANIKGEERIIRLCEILHADMYVNPIGGIELYHRDMFEKEGIELKFLKLKQDEIIYKQYNNSFVSNLSIIDVLMFNSKEEIKKMLNLYELI